MLPLMAGWLAAIACCCRPSSRRWGVDPVLSPAQRASVLLVLLLLLVAGGGRAAGESDEVDVDGHALLPAVAPHQPPAASDLSAPPHSSSIQTHLMAITTSTSNHQPQPALP